MTLVPKTDPQMPRNLNSIREVSAIPQSASLRQMNLVSKEDASPDVNLKRDLCAVSKGNYASVLECDVDSSTGALPQIRSELIKESSAAPARNRASILDSDHDEIDHRSLTETPLVSNLDSPRASDWNTRWDLSTISKGNYAADVPRDRMPTGLVLPGMEFVWKRVPREINLILKAKKTPQMPRNFHSMRKLFAIPTRRSSSILEYGEYDEAHSRD